ncbi:MAG: excinuclease ABC subunit UvrC [Pseudomonadota bacterium]|nr:excinuclease ABC subunit UvrC [Pseudomonadota bacterium]
MSENITNILKNITSRPGIYKFLDSKSKIIYIGKALNLKKRISSYFSNPNSSIKTTKLVQNINDIQTIITKNEEEALILENTLIKESKPKYNILLRDDKSYPYILINSSHVYPSIKFFRGQRKDSKGLFFGPYTQVNHVRYMLNLVQKIFKIRSCDDTYFANRKKPCLQYQINRCDAPCVNKITTSSYNLLVKNALKFLQGKNDSLIKSYSKTMMNLSHDKKYEEASEIRDKIQAIRSLTSTKSIINSQKNIDIITISSSENYHCIDVFLVRDMINLGNKTFDFKSTDSQTDVIESFINQYYLDNIPPEKIILTSQFVNINPLQNVLLQKYKKRVNLIYPTRKPFKNWFELCQINTNERLKITLSSKLKSNIFACLNKDIAKKNIIENAVCFDVSHLSGSNTQGSSVWFSSSGPDKSKYRRYNLNNIKKSDDYSAMNHIIKRRLSKLCQEDLLPELIVVDGGKGQITQAKNILNDLGIIDIILLGVVKGDKRLTKNDRVLDINFNDITLSLSNFSLTLLQKIRNEAHRFAITGQRNKAIKRQFESKLDSIPGIGKVRKLELLKYFGGIQGVLKSSVEDLTKAPGINSQLAKIIYKHLHLE